MRKLVDAIQKGKRALEKRDDPIVKGKVVWSKSFKLNGKRYLARIEMSPITKALYGVIDVNKGGAGWETVFSTEPYSSGEKRTLINDMEAEINAMGSLSKYQ